MKFIIILLCLWLDHYMRVGSRGRQQHFFNAYENFVKKIFSKSSFFQGPTTVALVAAPVIILVGVLQLVGNLHSDILSLLLGVAVVLFCLGASPLQYHIEGYLNPKEGQAAENETQLKAYLKEAGVKTHGSFHRGITELILSQSHERLFAIIFWFLILGPIGAITYRLISWFHDNAQHGEALYDNQLEHLTLAHYYAAWVPARLVALSYTLVGNFMASFDTWLKMALNPKVGQEILLACGDASLGLSSTPANAATLEENTQAIHLVQRTLLVWVLIIAVASMGQWIL